ncbi:hemolysin family protein [soil metagenome]
MNSLTIVIITLIASALSSGTEIAFLSANKLRIELDRKKGSIAARIISNFVKHPSRFIATMLVANNVSLVIYGIAMSEEILTPEVLQHILPINSQTQVNVLIVQTFLSTLLILVAAEFLPKVLFRIDPNRILNVLALPIQLIYYFLYPVVAFTIGISKFVLTKVVGVHFIEEKPVFGRVDLDLYIRDIGTKNSQEEEMNAGIQMFQNALDFTEVRVRESMVPRKELVSIDVEEPIGDLHKLFIETKLSRILVYRDNIDNIIGFVHSSEMFREPADIMQVLLPVTIVPEVMAANELLQLFIEQHRTIAVVVDEFGGTSGVVTMEDVMEEIFGEIQDEHDVTDTTEKKISETEFIFSGRLEIDVLNRKYDLDIPESEGFETLAGFIFHHHENIPKPNEEIVISPFTFTIMYVKENRIELVRMKVNRKED